MKWVEYYPLKLIKPLDINWNRSTTSNLYQYLRKMSSIHRAMLSLDHAKLTREIMLKRFINCSSSCNSKLICLRYIKFSLYSSLFRNYVSIIQYFMIIHQAKLWPNCVRNKQELFYFINNCVKSINYGWGLPKNTVLKLDLNFYINLACYFWYKSNTSIKLGKVHTLYSKFGVRMHFNPFCWDL